MSGAKIFRIVNVNKCIGCYTCQSVCEFLHGTPCIRVYKTSIGLEIPVSCLHCGTPPCVEVCPTGAMVKDETGIVYVNESKCIGCMACLYACPFGIPELDPEKGITVKCDLCRGLLAQGLMPACASMCPARAIIVRAPREVFDILKKKYAEESAQRVARSMGIVR